MEAQKWEGEQERSKLVLALKVDGERQREREAAVACRSHALGLAGITCRAADCHLHWVPPCSALLCTRRDETDPAETLPGGPWNEAECVRRAFEAIALEKDGTCASFCKPSAVYQ